jgi:hypothetical protein
MSGQEVPSVHPDPSRRPTAIAATAAALATAVAVGSDALAGGQPLHTASVGLVGVVVALLRIRLAGRYRGLFATVTASFLAQPVLHAATKVLDSPMPAGSAGHAIQETSFSVIPVVVAAAIVVAVACAEQLLHACDVRRAVRRWLRLLDLYTSRRIAGAAIGAVRATPGRRWAPLTHLHRRGPPVTGPVPAV